MGNFTVTNNWSTNGSTNVTNGDRGNAVSGNVTVTNGNWPAGAQAVMAAAGPQGGTAPPPPQGVRIVGAQSGRCVEIGGSSTTNGTQAQLWDCHGGTNQRWTHTASKQLMVYGNKCLDASGQGTANGTLAIIWDCNGQANQQWNVNANGTITGVHSGLCLDASGYGTANGTKVHLWACHGGTNQQWSLTRLTLARRAFRRGCLIDIMPAKWRCPTAWDTAIPAQRSRSVPFPHSHHVAGKPAAWPRLSGTKTSRR